MASFEVGLLSVWKYIGIATASLVTVLTLSFVHGVIDDSKRQQERKSYKRNKKTEYIVADDEVLNRFSKAIQCETVSWAKDKSSTEELLELHALIKEGFPTIYSSPLVQCEVINKYSLLFTIKGSESSLNPYLLISHLDVVPVTDQVWDVAPFSGETKDGYIWGRGTLDVKNGVMGSLEALEFLLKTGYCPKRGFFLAFGHDEEVNGLNGAANIAKHLKSHGVTLEFIQDEGLMIAKNFYPGVAKPVACIGIAEKGFMNVELTVESSVGHASMPPKESSIGILANAISRIEANPMPSTLGCGPEVETFKWLSPEFSYPMRIIASNLWFFKPVVAWFFSKKPSMNSFVRTTIAVTKINGGTKNNVIPASASAILNIRIHHGDSSDSITRFLRSVIKDERVQTNVLLEVPPSPIASTETSSLGYNTLTSSILDVFPDVAIAPGLLIACTDSRHFMDMTSQVYRFMPSLLTPEDFPRFHGTNERISIKNYEETINFYYRLMLNADTDLF